MDIESFFLSEFLFSFFEFLFFYFDDDGFFFLFLTDAISSLAIGSWIFIGHTFWTFELKKSVFGFKNFQKQEVRGIKIFFEEVYKAVSVPQGYFLSSASGH
jgi:hypothetical protein